MTYDGLLGQSWSQITTVHGLTDKTAHGETAEIFHEASNRWLQSAAYRFRDTANREKTVIAIHDITAVRNMTLALERSNAEIDGNRGKLQRALDELSRLIQEVTQKKDFSVRSRTHTCGIAVRSRVARNRIVPAMTAQINAAGRSQEPFAGEKFRASLRKSS